MQGESRAIREVRELVNRDIDALRNLQVTITAAVAQADQAQYETDQTHNERYQASSVTLAGVWWHQRWRAYLCQPDVWRLAVST